MAFKWVEPQNLHEARERRTTVAGEVESIHAQLSEKRYQHPDAEEDYNGWFEYQKWRGKVLWGLQIRLNELRRLNLWIDQHKDP